MITINDNIQKTYYAIAAVYLATLLAVVAIWGYTPCNDSDGYIIILKTKCSRYIKRSVTNHKTKRLFLWSFLHQ